MAGPLYRLLYCSRNLIAGEGNPPAVLRREVAAILEVSRRRNGHDNITGALLLTASGFAQVLEGYREAVERTFDRISQDPRHVDVSVLAFTPIERRHFPHWPMGFHGDIRAKAADPLAHLMSDATHRTERATTGGDLQRMLNQHVLFEEDWLTDELPVV